MNFRKNETNLLTVKIEARAPKSQNMRRVSDS